MKFWQYFNVKNDLYIRQHDLLRLFFLKIDVNIIAKSSLSSDSNSDSPKTVKKFQKAYAGKKVIKEYQTHKMNLKKQLYTEIGFIKNGSAYVMVKV